MNLKHGSPPSHVGASQALKPVGILYHGQPNRVPTMFRDQTINRLRKKRLVEALSI
jgi:hypothetical protein